MLYLALAKLRGVYERMRTRKAAKRKGKTARVVETFKEDPFRRPRTQQAVNELPTLSIHFWPRQLSAVGRAAGEHRP